jgi:hypothetical protein
MCIKFLFDFESILFVFEMKDYENFRYLTSITNLFKISNGLIVNQFEEKKSVIILKQNEKFKNNYFLNKLLILEIPHTKPFNNKCIREICKCLLTVINSFSHWIITFAYINNLKSYWCENSYFVGSKFQNSYSNILWCIGDFY